MTFEGLEQRLQKYYSITNSPAEFKKEVIAYIDCTESVADKNISFIKDLTKAATNMLLGDINCSNDSLEKVFRFSNEGIKRIEERRYEDILELHEERLIVLKAHLHAHAGTISWRLYEKADDRDTELAYAVDTYEHKKTAAELIKSINPNEAAIFYMSACDSTKPIVYILKKQQNKEEEREWFKKREDMAENALSVTTDPIIRAKANDRLGDISYILYAKTRNKKFSKKAKEYYKRFIAVYDGSPNSFNINEVSINIRRSRIKKISHMAAIRKLIRRDSRSRGARLTINKQRNLYKYPSDSESYG